MDALVLIGSFALLCLVGMPVAYALGLAAVVAAGVLGAHRRIGRQALAWGAVVTVACGVGTARRKSADRSHLALWSKTLEQHPDNPRARQGLAEA